MKSKKSLSKLIAFLILLAVIAMIFVANTYSKYATNASGSDSVVVAKWSFTVNDQEIAVTGDAKTIDFNLFETIYDSDGEEETDVVDGFIAPGTQGEFEFALKNTSEVTAQYAIKLAVDNINIPLEFSFDGEEWISDLTNLIAQDNLVTDTSKNVKVMWRWAFDANTETDSSLSEQEVNVTASITATQFDKSTQVTMLDGDGQTYYTLAPSVLSFRSSADIGDFQEVQINGETIDPANYTIIEGSTIINLSIDYLKTLKEDDYNISIVSKTGSTSAGFSVVEPDLNKHGFYYGQPYYAYVEDISCGYAFMMHENGMANIFTISIAMENMECPYTVEDNVITLHAAGGDIVGVISDDRKSIYSIDLNETLTLCNSKIVADEEYLYCYDEFYGGYEVKAMDKSKQYYAPIKSNIYGIDVVSLEGAFCDCVNMKEAPQIPYKVKNISDAYSGCESLKLPPKIPENVIGMLATFSGCTSLTTAPVIPNNVIDLSSAFYRCYNLTGTIEVNTSKINVESPASYTECFSDTILPIKIVGNCSEEIKEILASTAENGNVTYE